MKQGKILSPQDAGHFTWNNRVQPPILNFYDYSGSLQVGQNAQERIITGQDAEKTLSA